MEDETATPLEAPVEAPSASEDALANFLAEDEPTSGIPKESGDAEEAPATEEDAQKAEEGTEETPPQETYKVKVNGQELDVPLDELLKGYSRTEDYKAKTAQVAEQRRQAATEYADKLEERVALFEAMDPVLAQTRNVDWATLAATDPAQYVALKAQHDKRVATLENTYAEINHIRNLNAQREQEAIREYREQEVQALVSEMPELADGVKLGEWANGLSQYLLSQGFSPEDIAETENHKALIVANKARLYDELMAARQTAETKKTAPKQQPTLKPRAAENLRAPKRPGPTASDDVRRNWILAQLEAE